MLITMIVFERKFRLANAADVHVQTVNLLSRLITLCKTESRFCDLKLKLTPGSTLTYATEVLKVVANETTGCPSSIYEQLFIC